MLRVCLMGWAVFLVVVALSTAQAARADFHDGDCSWREQGQVLKFPDGEYHCACGRLTLPSGHYRVFCKWHRVTPALRRKPKARFAIATGVLA